MESKCLCTTTRSLNPLALAILLLVGSLLFSGCAASKAPRLTILEPVPERCFATPAATQITVGIVGEGWAIRFQIPRPRSDRPRGVLSVRDLTFFRGPDIQHYIRPSAGPPTPPIPNTASYSAVPLSDVTVRAVGGSPVSRPNGYLSISLSRFAVDGQGFTIAGPVHLPFRGPYP